MIVAGTGSRHLQSAATSVKADATRRTRAEVRELHARYGDDLVIMSGMAEGFDKLIALTALREGIPLWCAVPSRGYGAYYWGRASLTGTDRLGEFRAILAAASWTTYVMEDVHHTGALYLHGVHANNLRNLWMVEQAGAFVVWNPTTTGTRHCVEAIERAGKPYRVISPEPEESDAPQ